MAQGISIHAVDIARGAPAQGLVVEVVALEPERGLICTGAIGADSLLRSPALDRVFARGRYELLFHVGDYYRSAGAALPRLPFVNVIPFRFGIDEPLRHYHFPLKFTPWGCSLFVTCSGEIASLRPPERAHNTHPA